MFEAIGNFFKSIFGSLFGGNEKALALKSARLAGVFIANNNKAKVKKILPFAKAFALNIDGGKIATSDFKDFFQAEVLSQVKDPALKVLILEFIDYPVIQYGQPSEDAAELMEAFIEGLETGVA